MEQISVGKVALSTITEEVRNIRQEIGQLLVKSSRFTNFIRDLKDKRNQTKKEIQDLISSFDPLTGSTSIFTDEVKQLNQEIKRLKDEEEK